MQVALRWVSLMIMVMKFMMIIVMRYMQIALLNPDFQTYIFR